MPSTVCLHELFEQRVERATSTQVAVVHANEHLTYCDLNARANRLARHLEALGAGPDTLVAVCMERSLDMIVGLLGILKAGAAYVPCDPRYPAERTANILRDASPSILLTQDHLRPQILPDESRICVCVDRDRAAILQRPPANVPPRAKASNLAYVMYTSGSTGLPKGIAIAHSGVVSFMKWAGSLWSAEDLQGVLASTSICFDISLIELFVPLTCGGTLILAEDILQLPTLEHRDRVTFVNAVPSAMRELVSAHSLPPSVRVVILGGEPVDPQVVSKVYQQRGVRAVFNLYGPTEDTIYSTWFRLRANDDRAPIGRSLQGKRAYVLDSGLQLVPIGVTGSVYLAGDGVARGYHNRPALTASRFVANPFAASPGERMYHTGDLARWNQQQELEFVGRSDQQVKIRGFRIELGDIEATLRQHATVLDVAVIATDDGLGGKRLVAYVVEQPPGEVTLTELRSFLKRKLPDYMIPTSLLVLDALPLMPNGKVDRSALRAPDLHSRTETAYVAPRSAVENTIAQIFMTVLNRTLVSVEDDFFEIGGHSLIAVQVVARVRDAFGVEMPVRKLFENPSVAGIARLLEDETTPLPKSDLYIAPASRGAPLPLSFAEEMLRLQDRLTGGRTAFNVVAVARLPNSAADGGVLTRTLNEIIRRHEVLRTTFTTVAGRGVRRISDLTQFELRCADLECVAVAGDSGLESLIGHESRTGFNLATGPLFRITLATVAPGDCRVLITLPHIIADAWSVRVLVHDFETLYRAFANGDGLDLPESTIQYADYAQWLRQRLQGDHLIRLTAYWQSRLRGLSSPVPLPVLAEPAATHSGVVQLQIVDMSAADTQALRWFSQREGVTPAVTLLASFNELIRRLAGVSDVVVVMPVSERRLSELEGIVGLFMNFVFVRTDLSDTPTFRHVLRRVRDSTADVTDYQEMPFGLLLKSLGREHGRIADRLFQFGFNYVRQPGEMHLPPSQISRQNRPGWPSDIALHVHDYGQTIRLNLIGRESVFSPDHLTALGAEVKSIIARALTGAEQA